MKHSKVFIYGKHAVLGALEQAPRALTRVYLDPRAVDKGTVARIERAGIMISPLGEGVARADLKRGSAHQGLIGQLSLSELLVPFEHFLEQFKPSPDTALVLFAGITDPHNVGAIIRSAAALGVSAILMPQARQAPISASVIQVSAGMALTLPLVIVPHIEAALVALKKKGCKVYGLAGESKRSIGEEEFIAPSVFLFGNEGQGLPRELRGACEVLLSIPMHPRAESLNVAAAAAATLYAWSEKHPNALSL